MGRSPKPRNCTGGLPRPRLRAATCIAFEDFGKWRDRGAPGDLGEPYQLCRQLAGWRLAKDDVDLAGLRAFLDEPETGRQSRQGEALERIFPN
ncbi:hypothetical protein [Methylocapsa aurea]|uniref:hypothetical protein n=1 Tax=Methylocapsa aurea TaxID=663610 RepID=UPI00055D93D5|nr:hypothetical protein [Methylocapsa aurea]